MDWSFRIFAVAGIPIRVHWTLPLIMAVELVDSAIKYPQYLHFVAIGMALLFIHVLTHELGHCWGARRIGEGVDHVLLWPLGGMAYVGHSDDPRRDWIITIAGPAVTVLWGIVASLAIISLGVPWTWEFLNPFGAWWENVYLYGMGIGTLIVFLKLSVILAAFNLLIPAYPLDGGRLFLGFLSVSIGAAKAMRVSAVISFAIGLIMAVFAFKQGSMLTFAIGLWIILQAFGLYMKVGIEGGYTDTAYSGRGYVIRDDKPKESFWQKRRRLKRERALARRDAEEAALRARVDELLDKVNRVGMANLSPSERKALEDASSKLRRGS